MLFRITLGILNYVYMLLQKRIIFKCGSCCILTNNHIHYMEANQKEKGVTIIVNGREHEVEKEEITYAEIVALAFSNPPTDGAIFVVTYRRGHGNKPEGTLVEGGSVKVKKGMIFNVTPTNRA